MFFTFYRLKCNCPAEKRIIASCVYIKKENLTEVFRHFLKAAKQEAKKFYFICTVTATLKLMSVFLSKWLMVDSLTEL